MSQVLSQEEILRTIVQGEEGREWQVERSQGWTIGSSTTDSTDVCEWDGVSCNSQGQVTALKLAETDLFATIPTELALLSVLETIDLSRNLLQGTIPLELASMTSLVSVVLKDNRQVTGSIPVFKSSKLEILDLSRMGLTGRIPHDFGQPNLALTLLELRGNRFTGFLPFGLEDLPHLETISISNNALSGTLSAYLGNMLSLSFLYLDSNSMVGTIPTFSRPLQEVWLQSNALSGTIPSTIDATVLRDFYLDGNKLTGTVPPALCQDDLNADFFDSSQDDRNFCDSVTCPVGTAGAQGIFPCQNCTSSIEIPYLGQRGICEDWTEARIVNILLQRNKSSACDYADIVTCNDKGKVQKIHASAMKLSGTLPDALGLLEYLEDLDVSNNELEGGLPSGLRFAPLTSLRIGGNRLQGILPPLLCEKAGQINNGDGDCTSIACPMGTYSSDGSGFGICYPCAYTNGAPFLASTFCAPPIDTLTPEVPAKSSSSELIWGLLLGSVVVCMVTCCLSFMFVKNCANPRKRTGHWEKGANLENAGTSFPHAEEVKSMLQRFRTRCGKPTLDSKNRKKANWLQNHLNRTYHYVISLKETESIKEQPGNRVADVTSGEIDDYGWQERDSILVRRDLEKVVESHKTGSKLAVWEYPDPLEKPVSYSKSFDEPSDDDDDCDEFDAEEDDLSEWIRKQQSDPNTRQEWLDVPRIL